MQEIDLEYDSGQISMAEASSIVKRELEQNASFQVSESGSPSGNSVTYNASMNGVTVYEGPRGLEITGRAEPKAADAIKSAIRSQAEGGQRNQTRAEQNKAERDYSKAEFEGVGGPADTTADFGPPIREVNEAEEEHGELEARVLVYDDGHTHIYYRDGDDRHFHSDAGLFLNTDGMDVMEMFTVDSIGANMMDKIKNSGANEMLDALRRELR